MYDAADRRFMAVDLVKDGNNWYAYSENNPVTLCDPSGRTVMIGGTTYATINKNDTYYASVRDLIDAYGGVWEKLPTTRGNTTYYKGTLGLYEFYLYVMKNGLPSSELEFRPKPSDTNRDLNLQSRTISSNAFYSVNGTNYIDVTYFCRIMCNMGYNLNYRYVDFGFDIQEFLRIARGEVGFAESYNPLKRSYIWKENWCAEFVSWVANQAGVRSAEQGGMERSASTGTIMRWYIEKHRFRMSASVQEDARSVNSHILNPNSSAEGSGYQRRPKVYHKSKAGFKELFGKITDANLDSLLKQANDSIYRPKEGDLIIFRSKKYGPHNHIGIVVAERYPMIYTVEGNTGTIVNGNLDGKVDFCNYNVTAGTEDYMRVMGFCQNGGTSRGTVPAKYSKGTGEGV